MVKSCQWLLFAAALNDVYTGVVVDLKAPVRFRSLNSPTSLFYFILFDGKLLKKPTWIKLRKIRAL